MPILRNAKKALKVSQRRAAMNTPIRSRVKTAVDAAKKKAEAGTLSTAFSAIDKAVKHHIIHRKKAARMKSQLALSVTKVAAKPTKPSKAAKKTAK